MEVSPEEQWEVLAALYKYGTNIEAVNKALPDWGPEKLQHYIKCSKNAAQRRDNPGDRIGEVSCLTHWLSHTENMQMLQGTHAKDRKRGRLPSNFCPSDHGPLLSKVMKYISEEEDHPAPSSPSEPDYREIYRYLSQVLAGEEPSQMSQGSAAKVMEMLKKVEKMAACSRHKGKVNHYFHMNPPSHLAPWAKRNTTAQNEVQEVESQECPLFCETTEDEVEKEVDEDLKDLPKDDPHFELKKWKALKKCEKKQKAMASSLSDVPGLDPFGLPSYFYVKPKQTTLDALLNC